MISTPLKILKKYWNYDSFRTPQNKIIEAVLKGNDVIALLPTGGGKSICFQIPGIMQEGICIVISPLIALMEDQVLNLNKRGVKAITIKSGSSQDDIITLFDNLQFGNYKFLYISPERLQSPFIHEKIKQLTVNLIAIDEAHCISEWGHDFRPSYRNIKILKELKPTTKFIALTASATQEVLEDISKSLALTNLQVFKESFSRNNLAYQIFSVEDKLHRLLQIFTKTKAPAIVYVSSRNKTKEISNYLNANGFLASYYHGGLSTNEKQEAFDNWMLETTTIMVATNAFGMGIDKGNVKVVVHLDIPNSIESYIQEAGRAGRNGKKSFAVMLQNSNDIRLFEEKSIDAFPSLSEIKEIYKKLHQQYQISNGEITTTSFEFNSFEFGNSYRFPFNKLNNALKILINNGVIELSENHAKKSSVQFLATSSQVIHYAKKNTSTQLLINTILRSYGGLFEQETNINEYWLAKKSKITLQKAIQFLEQLQVDGIVTYKKVTSNSKLTFLVPREDNIAINRISKNIIKYLEQKKRKSDAIIRFIKNADICRSIQVLQYFDEKEVSECGICDVCLSKKKNTENISVQITSLLKSENACTSKKICTYFSFNDEVVLLNLQQLLSEDIIAINKYNQYYLKT